MMKNAALFSGWVVAIVLGALLYNQILHTRLLTSALEAEKVVAKAAHNAATQMAALERATQPLEALSADPDVDKTAMIVPNPTPPKEHAEPEGVVAADLVEDILKNSKKEKDEKANPMSSMATMFEGERGEKMMKASVGPMVTMQYQELFNGLQLPEEQANALRAVLTDHMEANAMAGLAMMRGEEEGDVAPTHTDDDLRDAVAEILDPNELEAFDAYQDELPERMMRQQFETQLGMLAPSLSEDARQYTLDVLVDAMLADPDVEQAVDGGMMGNLELTRSRLEAAAARLDTDLGPEEAVQVRAFIDQQLAGLDMAAAMFGQDGEEKEPQ